MRLLQAGSWRVCALGIVVLFLPWSGYGQTRVPASNEVKKMESQDSARWVMRWPRMLFTPDRLTRLRQRLQSEPASQGRRQRLLEAAEKLLQAEFFPQTVADQGTGQHANYARPAGQINDMAQTLGLAYLLTGEERYAAKLRDGLLFYSRYSGWCPPPMFPRGWHSELQTASFCMAYAMGYDVLHDYLRPEERTQIARAMVDKGILPIPNDWVLPQQRIHTLDSMGHNWWSVCVSSAGLAALSLVGDEPQAYQWVKQAERGLTLWFDYRGNLFINKGATFDPAGAFYESVGYADYALHEYLLFRLACGDALVEPPPQIPVLGRMSNFFLNTFYPASSTCQTVDLGDHKSNRYPAQTMRLLLANGLGDGRTQWYLSRTQPAPTSPLGMLLESDRPVQKPDGMPTSVLYPEIGWAMLRSSWADDATLLAVKSGTFWNHAHADAGSFILFHHGMPLITDSEACDYGAPAYVNYYVQSRAHNVVMFEERGEPEENRLRGAKFPGHVRHLFDQAGLKYVCADATGPMAHRYARHYRHWLWLDGVILVFDDLLAHDAGWFDWLLHYQGTAEQGDQGTVLTNGPARALVKFLFPQELRQREEVGLAPYAPAQRVPYLVYSPVRPARQQYFLCAILPFGEEKQPLPQLEYLQGEGMMGVRIRHEQQVTEVYLNLRDDGANTHENSRNVLGGWESDAYLLAVTRPATAEARDLDALSRCLVINGSYVRREGRSVLDSLSKVDALVVPEGQRMAVWVYGQPMLDLAVRSASRPAAVLVNGKPVEAEYVAKEQVLRLAADGRE